MTRNGLLLVNLGTPNSPQVGDVRRFLREFLMDPRVIDLPWLFRFLLVHLFVLPFRPRRSAAAYRKVWTADGSPLLANSRAFARALVERLPGVPVELAMRYGNPGIGAAMDRLRSAGADRIVVLPLFPQYSEAAWGSALEAVVHAATASRAVPSLHVVPPFFDHPAFLEAQHAVAAPILEAMRPDRVLVSFHGLPERQCRSVGGPRCVVDPHCCDTLRGDNRNCYRAQCFETARCIAARLNLAPGSWEVSFQSRMGRTPWIRPYTDEVVKALPGLGVRSVAIISPSFVADCLETLEEIALRAAEDFRAHGGEKLVLIPSLNATTSWVEAAAVLVDEVTPG